MELNPKNDIIKKLNIKFKKDPANTSINGIIEMLYEISLLTSGFSLQDPMLFAKRFNKILSTGLSIDDDEDEEELEIDEELVLDKNTDSSENEESTMEHVD